MKPGKGGITDQKEKREALTSCGQKNEHRRCQEGGEEEADMLAIVWAEHWVHHRQFGYMFARGAAAFLAILHLQLFYHHIDDEPQVHQRQYGI